SWQGTGPSVELYDIVAEGAPPATRSPFFQAESLRVQVTITSFLHRNWYVNDFRIEHPVARMYTDHEGRMNLPPAHPSGNTQNQTSVFDLGVRRLAIERGEVFYNDRKNDLVADIHELALQTRFYASPTRYEGTLSYRDGHLQWQTTRPLTHNLDVRF